MPRDIAQRLIPLIRECYDGSMSEKILIIRFSSFGDIVQCMSCLGALKGAYPDSDIHWVARSEFSELVGICDEVDQVWSFDRAKGLIGLLKLGFELRKQKFTKVYDAHSNLRSRILSMILCPFIFGPSFKRRAKERLKRILLFTFRKNFFPKPYKGMDSYNQPISEWTSKIINQSYKANWSFSQKMKENVEAYLAKGFKDPIALVPSAAWEMKRWPLDYWKKLIKEMPDKKIVILGGPADSFCKELEDISPDRVLNLAGKLSLIESCFLISKSSLTISADTGLLHVADLLNIPGIALIGPTAFGFPSGSHIKTMEVALDCRPCTKDGRGGCSRDIYQQCMIDIKPEDVAKEAIQIN